MTISDPWNSTDSLTAPALDVMIERLEMRGRFAPFLSMMDDYLDAAAVDTARDVLDLGCGTGVASRRVAGRLGFSGDILGIDLSPYLVAAGARFAEDEGHGDRITFRAGDSHGLALPDASFDVIVAHTLFSHLTDPAAVLGEIRRLLRAGGRAAIFDGDYGSIIFELDDAAQSERFEKAMISAVCAQPRVLRRFPRLARDAGLEIQAVQPGIIAETGQSEFWISAAGTIRTLGPRSGILTRQEADDMVDQLVAASERGVFFGACAYYAYIVRPAG